MAQKTMGKGTCADLCALDWGTSLTADVGVTRLVPPKATKTTGQRRTATLLGPRGGAHSLICVGCRGARPAQPGLSSGGLPARLLPQLSRAGGFGAGESVLRAPFPP